MIRFTLLFLNFLGFTSALSQKIEAVPNGQISFQNLYRINDSIYRSEQPVKTGMTEVEKMGIHSLLNLRNFSSDNSYGTSIRLYHIRINTWVMSEAELLEALKILLKSEKPVLVHCKHGSDRTGTVIAAYRIVFENWSKEDAITEMLSGTYGFHSNFQNLLVLLRNLDVEKMKRDLGLI